ncbi:MAG TPA: 2OG-Fe(II) oxygenase family protein [Ktedonobacteraceae bacterium]|nr:2OG-Fe(II) oxygenase family protein [Ktedonobacteraceae bacterium]
MRDTGNKRHDLHGRNLISQGELYTPKTGVFPDVWVRLANELLSDAYRDALTVASGIQLNDLQIDATLWHHPKGSFLDPHPDKPDKVLVHLFYFCEEDWSPDFGGCLRILRSSNIDDFAVEILPLINTSTYFIRSDQSWHGYKAMTAADRVRLSLQVVFYKGGMHYTKPLTE